MVTIKITVSLDDAGSLLHKLQDLVFSVLNTTVTYAVSEHRKLFLSGTFHFPFSHSLYIIYLYCALINYNQIFIHFHIFIDIVISLLSPLLFCYMLLCHWVVGVWYLVSQDSDVFFSSRVEKSTRNDMDIVSLKDKTTMLSQNIWH